MPIHNWAYVEDNIFQDFHNVWITGLCHTLNSGVLPEGYFASTDETAFGYKPDVLALERFSPGNSLTPVGYGGPAGSLAVATAPPRVSYTASTAMTLTTKKPKRLMIRTAEDEKVVAVIEIVSRGNKKSADAFDTFLSKCQLLLESDIQLLIVDLHAPTSRDPNGIHGAIWQRMHGIAYTRPDGKPLTAVSYAVNGVLNCFVEPLAVGDAIPDIPLFLDADYYINVPLEACYLAAFAEVPAHRRAHVESLSAA